MKIVDTKTSQKCITVDEETATFLSKSNKLQGFKKEQFDKRQVLINPELPNPLNIWIVCEKPKIDHAEQELTSLTIGNKISSCTFRAVDPTKVRFLREHCWDKIKGKEKSCNAEGVVVLDIDAYALEIKGTNAGRNEMMNFLQELTKSVDFKVGRFLFL